MDNHHTVEENSEDLRRMKKNTALVMGLFKKTMHLVDDRIQDGLVSLQSSLDELSLKDGLENCLDSYCQFVACCLPQLIKKGVVSVEYSTETDVQKKKNETPATTASNKTDLLASHPHNPYGKPEAPFLPMTSKKYTLVLDLDETLVHYEDNGVLGQFYLRPYAQEFLDEMAKYYEVVIFTAALQDYADWIIDRLDSNRSITHRLYRQHTSASNGNYHVKVSSVYDRTSRSSEETCQGRSSSTTFQRTSNFRPKTESSSRAGSRTPTTARFSSSCRY